MNPRRSYIFIVVIFSLIAVISLIYKVVYLLDYYDSFLPNEKYTVTYRYYFQTSDEETNVRAYLPINTERQRLFIPDTLTYSSIKLNKEKKGNNIRAVWTTKEPSAYKELVHTFTFEGKKKQYQIAENFNYKDTIDTTYLKSTEFIQVDDEKINQLAQQISDQFKTDRERIQEIFKIVYEIPAAPIITRTDAATALKQNRASCNGKSRLFLALTRNLGYPSRMVGGIVLEEIDKRTTHAWVEVYDGNQWIPFDALNNHYAYIPANYMQVQYGDEYMISHTKDIDFDYIYEITKQSHIPFFRINSQQFNEISPITLWGLVESGWITKQPLLLLLMLPLGGLIVAFLRNVVGLKTFGVFLPVLIAFALFETGFWVGLLLFISLILLVGIIARPFDVFGLLHTPKLVISLTLMVVVMAAISYAGYNMEISWLSMITVFPTIILTISAERFSNLIVEEDFPEAVWMLIQTLIAVSICYLILKIEWLSSIVIIFPEVLLLIIVLSLLLGRYIGIRWTEFFRFNKLIGKNPV